MFTPGGAINHYRLVVEKRHFDCGFAEAAVAEGYSLSRAALRAGRLVYAQSS